MKRPKPHISGRYGWWRCAFPAEGAVSGYGITPEAAYRRWLRRVGPDYLRNR